MERQYARMFETLPGQTIAEYHKNFNQYLRLLETNRATIDAHLLLGEIRTEYKQQEIFYARLVAHFGCTEAFRSTLHAGKPHMVKTLLRKCDFNALLVDGLEEFIVEVCGCVSSATRRKFINAISAMKRADFNKARCFRRLSVEYGVEACKALLINAEEVALMRACIAETRIVFNSTELIRIFRNYGLEIVEFYYAQRARVEFSAHKKLARYLIANNRSAFCALLPHGYPQLSRKNLKRVVLSGIKVDLSRFPNPNFNSMFYLIGRDEYARVFARSLDTKPDNFVYSPCVEVVLKRFKREERGRFLFGAFRAKYGFEIDANYVNARVLSALALEDRLKLIIKPQNVVAVLLPDEEGLCYGDRSRPDYTEMLPIEEALRLLKERIDATTDSTNRSALASKLVDVCRINSDFAALKDVLRYFNKRHKNDDYALRNEFYTNVMRSFKHKDDPEFWGLVKEAVDLFTVNKEFFDGIEDYLERTIYVKHTLREDYGGDLTRYMRDKGPYMEWNLLRDKPLLERACILRMESLIERAFVKEDERVYAHDTFFWTISDYNKRNRVKISPLNFPETIALIKASSNPYLLRAALKFRPVNQRERAVFNDAIAAKTHFYTAQTSRWLLDNQPDFVHANIARFFRGDHAFLKEIARFHTLRIHSEFHAHALRIIGAFSTASNDFNCLEGAFAFLVEIPSGVYVLERFLCNFANAKRLLKVFAGCGNMRVNLNVLQYFMRTKNAVVVQGLLYRTINRLSEDFLVQIFKLDDIFTNKRKCNAIIDNISSKRLSSTSKINETNDNVLSNPSKIDKTSDNVLSSDGTLDGTNDQILPNHNETADQKITNVIETNDNILSSSIETDDIILFKRMKLNQSCINETNDQIVSNIKETKDELLSNTNKTDNENLPNFTESNDNIHIVNTTRNEMHFSNLHPDTDETCSVDTRLFRNNNEALGLTLTLVKTSLSFAFATNAFNLNQQRFYLKFLVRINARDSQIKTFVLDSIARFGFIPKMKYLSKADAGGVLSAVLSRDLPAAVKCDFLRRLEPAMACDAQSLDVVLDCYVRGNIGRDAAEGIEAFVYGVCLLCPELAERLYAFTGQIKEEEIASETKVNASTNDDKLALGTQVEGGFEGQEIASKTEEKAGINEEETTSETAVKARMKEEKIALGTEVRAEIEGKETAPKIKANDGIKENETAVKAGSEREEINEEEIASKTKLKAGIEEQEIASKTEVKAGIEPAFKTDAREIATQPGSKNAQIALENKQPLGDEYQFVNQSKHLTNKLITAICEKSLRENETQKPLLLLQTLEAHIAGNTLLNLTAHYLQYAFQRFAQLLWRLHENSSESAHGFVETLKRFFAMLDGDFALERTRAAKDLLAISKRESALIIVIGVLPSCVQKNETLTAELSALIAQIEACNMSVIDVYLRKYLMGF